MITAKHCGYVSPKLKLGVLSADEPRHDYAVNTIYENPTLDVEALFLRQRSGLSVLPLRETVDHNWFYAWGYGQDWSGNPTRHLTRADFNAPEQCPANYNPAVDGALCWQTTARNSICYGDSGGPVTQNHAIIGVVVRVIMTTLGDCRTTFRVQALGIRQMQPWLNQMIKDAGGPGRNP